MIQRFIDFIKKFLNSNKAEINNSPNSTNIIGNNNTVNNGQKIEVDEKNEMLVIKNLENKQND